MCKYSETRIKIEIIFRMNLDQIKFGDCYYPVAYRLFFPLVTFVRIKSLKFTKLQSPRFFKGV